MNDDKLTEINQLTELLSEWLRRVIKTEALQYPLELTVTDSMGWLFGIRVEQDGSTQVSCKSWSNPLYLTWPFHLRVFDAHGRSFKVIISKDCSDHSKSPREEAASVN